MSRSYHIMSDLELREEVLSIRSSQEKEVLELQAAFVRYPRVLTDKQRSQCLRVLKRERKNRQAAIPEFVEIRDSNGK